MRNLFLYNLKKHLERNEVIHKNQFGLVDGSNTTLAATLNFTEKLYDYLNGRKYVAVIKLDLAKAFDSVNLEILTHKLILDLNSNQSSRTFHALYIFNMI